MARLPSTGRKPALDLIGLEALLTAYYGEDQPSISELAERQELTEATVRKYLKLALGSLPRGRAACMPREARNVKALLNSVPTEALLGAGRTELLLRRREAGESFTSLARDFGISRDRVSKLVRASLPEPAMESEPAQEVASASPETPEQPESVESGDTADEAVEAETEA